MMKRLHFLRRSLDSHNPHETTLRMRDNAMKKRDERILELWHKDQMQPTVQELVNKMIAEKGKEVRHDWADDYEEGESLIEQDMRSIGSNEGKTLPSQNQLQQNSLYSSI